MAKKKEVDIDEEVERIARKTNFNMRRTEYSYDKQLKRLDSEIDKVLDNKIKQFDDDKSLTEEYLSLEFNHDTVDRYREKLRKM